jgi:hypothetical protein
MLVTICVVLFALIVLGHVLVKLAVLSRQDHNRRRRGR